MGTSTDSMTHTAKWAMRAFMAPLLYYFAFHAPAVSQKQKDNS
jgi:hypothetical protein